MTDNSLNDLDAALKPLCEQFIQSCSNKGMPIVITETFRDPVREDMLHAQGITPATSKTCEHCHTLEDGTPASRAFDFLIKNMDGSIIADGTNSAYHLAGQVAEDLGLVWGGRFRHPDYDHVQLK